MDQSSTTQAYVSGWKESLKLNENELVEFTTFFSIGYAIGIVPAQMIQTRIRPSLFLPACEIVWGFMTLATFACKSSGSVYVVRFFLGIFESTSWPGLVLLILNWCMLYTSVDMRSSLLSMLPDRYGKGTSQKTGHIRRLRDVWQPPSWCTSSCSLPKYERFSGSRSMMSIDVYLFIPN